MNKIFYRLFLDDYKYMNFVLVYVWVLVVRVRMVGSGDFFMFLIVGWNENEVIFFFNYRLFWKRINFDVRKIKMGRII